jgi:hypothetical protein
MQRLLRLATLFACVTVPALGHAGGDGARKSGEWEISVTVSGQSPYTSKYCIDAASDDLQTAYRGEVVRNDSPPLYGRTEVKSTVEARYLGNCS